MDEAVQRAVPEQVRGRIEFLGMVSDEDKGRLFHSVDVYCAPNTGGESFGIILVEAMSGGAPVLASDLDAFSLVLEAGAAGAMFPNGNAAALAREAITLLGDPARRPARRLAEAEAVRRVRLVRWWARTSCPCTRRWSTASTAEDDRGGWRAGWAWPDEATDEDADAVLG